MRRLAVLGKSAELLADAGGDARSVVQVKLRLACVNEKLGFSQQAEFPGGSMSVVPRPYGLAPSQLFRWRRLRDEGTLVN